MSKETKNVDQILISKDKLLKGILITIGVLLLIIVCFMASSNNTEKYSDSTTTDESSSDDVLEIATKEAGEVADDERKSPNEIDVEQYINLYNGSENSVVLFSRPTCSYCQLATPILENIIYQYGVDINYLNTDNLDDNGNATIVSSDEYFSEGYGTPLIIVVGNGKIVDTVEGLTTKDSYIEFFKKYGFME